MTRTRHPRARLPRAPRRQTCKVCGCQDKFDFHVSDDLWKKIVPQQYRKSVVCLPCFDVFASEKQIDYSGELRMLYFAGDRAAFTFEAVSAADIY